MMFFLLIVHVMAAIAIIALVLLQHGKGADAGAAFGGGASGTVFGAKGSASFLTRLTAGLATIFFITSLALAYFGKNQVKPKGSLMEQAAQKIEQSQPVETPPVSNHSTLPTVSDEEASVDVPPAPVSENADSSAEVDVPPPLTESK
jgi:preprotein translocase subunit SecG